MTDATVLDRASKAAKREIDKLRRTRVPEYPGSWRTHEGLGWENLDDVVAATIRAVLMAVREPGSDLQVEAWLWAPDGDYSDAQRLSDFTAMIDAILADGEGR